MEGMCAWGGGGPGYLLTVGAVRDPESPATPDLQHLHGPEASGII